MVTAISFGRIAHTKFGSHDAAILVPPVNNAGGETLADTAFRAAVLGWSKRGELGVFASVFNSVDCQAPSATALSS
jgi:hypothetical protein